QPESKPRGMKDGVSPIRGAVESVERPTRLRGTASSSALSYTLLTRDDHGRRDGLPALHQADPIHAGLERMSFRDPHGVVSRLKRAEFTGEDHPSRDVQI